MKLGLRIWRQDGAHEAGRFERFAVAGLERDMSLLDALDVLNERLVREGTRPIAFESDCREGICGACGVVVDGQAHGPRARTTSCELRLSAFEDGAELTLEPFRAAAFPVLRDLIVDRSALDRIVQAGGYVSVKTGSAPEANAIPIAKAAAESALDAAACIGCGACVAACPNRSASLFTAAKLAHLAQLPQGAPERARRTLAMIGAADSAGFGACSLHGECQAACPKGIGLDAITRMQREFVRAAVR
jgi:succinate dehydrogenase / fumarate reductase, iron-sulfur subunit